MERADKAQQGEAPWLSKPEWAAGKIVYSAHAPAVILTVLLAGFGALLFFALTQSNEKVPPLGLLILGVIELLFLMATAKAWRSLLAFGGSTLLLATRPGVIGGELAGALRVKLPKLDPTQKFSFELTCHRESAKVADERYFEQKLVVEGGAGRADGDHFELPFRFSIPAGLPDASSPADRNGIIWRLDVQADVNGSPYQSVFVVPVFRVHAGAESARDVR